MPDGGRESGFRAMGQDADDVAGHKAQVESAAAQVSDAVSDAYGKAVDAATEGAQRLKGAATAGHDSLRKFMEDNPHTTTVIALAIGVLIGYAARRPPPRRNWWS